MTYNITGRHNSPQPKEKVVCLRCARIKQACSGDLPCLRCKRLDVICEPNIRNGTRLCKENTSFASTAKITRTHTGCLICRKRKKKCDEQRPRCFDCRRLCLECEYPAPRQTRKRTRLLAPTVEFPSPEEFESGNWETDNSPEAIAEANIDLLNAMTDSSDWTQPVDIWACIIQSQTATSSDELERTPFSNSPVPMAMLSAAPNLAAEDDPLLNHYISVVAKVLSRRDDNHTNPYLSIILPTALGNQIVMDAVLALSASHWKSLEPTLWKRGMIHQTRALQALTKLLWASDNDSMDSALSVTLILCMIELYDGISSHWKVHLDGARRLLFTMKQSPGSPKRTELRTFFSKLYHYLDSATTISTCRPPLMENSEELRGTPDRIDENATDSEFHEEEALYGIPRSLFHFLDKINSLAYQRKFRDDSIFDEMFKASAVSLTKDLDEWGRRYRSNKLSGAESIDHQEQATLHATIAYEQALHLRLHQVVHGYSTCHEKVKECVQKILEAVQAIRYGSPLESSLIFPLVLAGSSCDSEAQRLIIRDRFLVMERTLGFQHIYKAHELIRRVWAERDKSLNSDVDVNWAAIRYFQIPGLVFV